MPADPILLRAADMLIRAMHAIDGGQTWSSRMLGEMSSLATELRSSATSPAATPAVTGRAQPVEDGSARNPTDAEVERVATKIWRVLVDVIGPPEFAPTLNDAHAEAQAITRDAARAILADAPASGEREAERRALAAVIAEDEAHEAYTRATELPHSPENDAENTRALEAWTSAADARRAAVDALRVARGGKR